MRRISLIVAAAMLLFTGSVFGYGFDQSDPTKKKVEKQVKELLEGYYQRPAKDVVAKILFTVNLENEIVVLSVETDNPRFEEYIKNRLNYEEVAGAIVEEGDKFVVRVRLLS